MKKSTGAGMNPLSEFDAMVSRNIDGLKEDSRLKEQSHDWLLKTLPHHYSYNFRWQGRPIIQYPQDIVAMQELVWTTRPDLIIETGIAHGGSLILSASLLAMLDYTDAIKSGEKIDPRTPRRRVLGIDIDIRAHNREAILAHPFASHIDMLQGSSIDPTIVAQVQHAARGYNRVMVCLDSNHTHAHVLAELSSYAPLVTPGNYCVVYDTIIEDLPAGMYPDRPWDVGNNPKTAVQTFLAEHPEFVVDRDIEAKIQITVAPGGYLRRMS